MNETLTDHETRISDLEEGGGGSEVTATFTGTYASSFSGIYNTGTKMFTLTVTKAVTVSVKTSVGYVTTCICNYSPSTNKLFYSYTSTSSPLGTFNAYFKSTGEISFQTSTQLTTFSCTLPVGTYTILFS